MKRFADAIDRGVPVVALRTSTHAFNMPASSNYKQFTAFGKESLGEQWVSHWGSHNTKRRAA